MPENLNFETLTQDAASRINEALLTYFAHGDIEVVDRRDIITKPESQTIWSVTANWRYTSTSRRDLMKNDLPNYLRTLIKDLPFDSSLTSNPQDDNLEQFIVINFGNTSTQPYEGARI